MNESISAATGAASATFVMPLEHLGTIAVHGDDARSFLQGQLTNDVLKLTPDQARLNGYCSPKGRLLATFYNWTDGKTIWLAAPIDLIEPVQRRLSMFVMRSKVKLEAAHLLAFGFIGSGATEVLQTLFGTLPQTPWGQVQGKLGTLIRVPDANGAPRWVCWIDTLELDNLREAVVTLPQAGTAYWRWLDIRAGLPWITLATQEKFVPQMVNFEALGGVDFKKGCFPGQEIVARSQYLGKLKRRTMLAHARLDQPPPPGNDVFGADDSPVGVVVNAESSPQGGVDLLVELPVAEQADLHLGTAGTALQLLDLPYELPDNEVFVRPKL